MSNKKTTKQNAAEAGLPSLSKSELKEWREETTLDRMINHVPRLIQARKYEEATKLGALHGANYLASEMRDGKSNDDASFSPELFLFTGKRELKLAGLVLVQVGDQNPKEAVKNAVAQVFKQRKLAAILAVVSGFTTKKVESLKKGQSLRNNASRKIRTSAAFSMLYIKPEQFESFASVAVGTPQELKRAGFTLKDGPMLVGRQNAIG